nr:unnamed protein product [Digitaria exilis]
MGRCGGGGGGRGGLGGCSCGGCALLAAALLVSALLVIHGCGGPGVPPVSMASLPLLIGQQMQRSAASPETAVHPGNHGKDHGIPVAAPSKDLLCRPCIHLKVLHLRNPRLWHQPLVWSIHLLSGFVDCTASCEDPLTNSPPGTTCLCVLPIKVELQFAIALYTFFTLVAELAQDIASGVLMNQSQVRVMGANAAPNDPEKTIVFIDLVPLGPKFDNAIALSVFERFWQKKVIINRMHFGKYDVLDVQYVGPDYVMTGNRLESRPISASPSFSSSLVAYKGSAKAFSLFEMERATQVFDECRIIGEGGFGRVYEGIFEDGERVAIKVLKRDDQQGSDKGAARLDWDARLKIALGAARALAYLHEDSSPRVIHRDFKSSNILLEHDFTPKVSDFGLARTALGEGNEHISTRVMGTFGYVAPEYAMTGHLLVKSDVYSYGVVLLELLTGRKPVDMSRPPGQENLVAWASSLLTSRDGLESIIDPSLGSNIPFDSIAKVAAIASMCVQPEVDQRPFMGEVVQALKLVCNEGSEFNGSTSFSQDLHIQDVEIMSRANIQVQVLYE